MRNLFRNFSQRVLSIFAIYCKEQTNERNNTKFAWIFVWITSIQAEAWRWSVLEATAAKEFAQERGGRQVIIRYGLEVL